MLEITYSSQFKKDFKKARKLPLSELKLIFEVISTLEQETSLDAKHKDHELISNGSRFRECHIKSDLLLIYKNVSELLLARIGTHSDLF